MVHAVLCKVMQTKFVESRPLFWPIFHEKSSYFERLLYATSMGITYIFSPSGLMVSIAIRRRPSFPKQILSVKQQLHYYSVHCNLQKNVNLLSLQ